MWWHPKTAVDDDVIPMPGVNIIVEEGDSPAGRIAAATTPHTTKRGSHAVVHVSSYAVRSVKRPKC